MNNRESSSVEQIISSRKISRSFSIKSIQSPVPANVFKGLALAFMSGVFYSTCSVIVKHVKHLHPGQLALYRSIAIFFFSFPEVTKAQKNPLGPPNMRFLLFLRGIFGASNLFLNFLAFRYLPLGEAAVIIFSVPVFVTVMARIFLNEPCGFMQTITAIITVLGILLITRVPEKLATGNVQYTTENVFGLSAALLSLLFNSSRFIILRKLKNVHHSVTMFNYGWVAIIENCTLTFLIGDYKWHDCGKEQWLMIILGIFSYLGQNLLTMALQCELAGPVSTVRAAADIILAFIFQAAIFKHTPDGTSIIGAILVSSCIIFVGLRKFAIALPEHSELRTKLRWLTL